MHRKGRFGALTVVVKDGNIEFVSFNASMLPDNPQQRYGSSFGHATVLLGVYYIKSGYSGADDNYAGFATGVNKNPYDDTHSDIPIYRLYNEQGKKAPGFYNDPTRNDRGTECDIHPGWDPISSYSSSGCLTILTSDYEGFMTATGLNLYYDYSKTKPRFTNPHYKSEIGYADKGLMNNQPLPNITGAVVIDRSLVDPVYLKEMY